MHAIQQIYFLTEKRLTDRLIKERGITFSQLLILTKLHTKATNSQHAIAADLELAEATVSRYVNALERAKYITRKADPTNQRKYIIAITPKGLKVFTSARTIIEREITEMFGVVPQKHRQDMATMLKRVHEKLTHGA